MGEARNRGTFEVRKAQAIAAGREKLPPGIRMKDFHIEPIIAGPPGLSIEEEEFRLRMVDRMLESQGVMVVRPHRNQER